MKHFKPLTIFPSLVRIIFVPEQILFFENLKIFQIFEKSAKTQLVFAKNQA